MVVKIPSWMAAVKRLIPDQRRGYRWQRYGLVAALLLSVTSFFTWLAASPKLPDVVILPPLIIDEPFMPRRGARNIIFVETTCAIENVSWSGLRPRQACAVESAARHHPGWHIYVLHTCVTPLPVRWVPAGATAVYVPLAEFLSDTPLYTPLIEQGALAASHWPIEHASDVMRLVALWKYGGVYLDLDFVVLRQLSELGENWAGAEDSATVANCALSLSARPDSAGPEVAAACLQSLRDCFDGEQWTHNGPALLTRILAQRCNADSTAAMADCGGFRVLPAALFFPVHYNSWQMYFSEEDANTTLAKLETAYAVHVWNKLSRISRKTLPHSAYAKIARVNCPDAYESALDGF
ncbi:lactosylceramide 4-alpha-galactosyltransferase-like isoform X2 [Schistocerca serialis cubense]|uniref:lactosylceramide 4-alpha-galactosyltransferase-like isoform X2 n=1 Tax=Schistocerca serialis cubense TaxID=2023355 RepID=UPI00214F36DF|nr:lactosylceramide 4-alpha-galactosyltransferase-like isoform X2 [Schistocerca serialis cubense]